VKRKKSSEIGIILEGSEHILHHTISSDKSSATKLKGKGITWPARHLARDIGPRAPGSQQELSAARFIETEFKSLGADAEVQRFRTPVTTAWSEMLVHLIVIFGVVIFPANSHISYALICLGFFLYLLESYGRSPFIWLQQQRRSQNVVLRLEPLREARRTLVIIAHMDSPRTAFYHRPGFVRLIRGAFLLDFACIASLFMLFTVVYAGYLLSMEKETLTLLWKLGLVIAAVPALAFLALLSKAAGPSTPGGNDNASGVAVLLELARTYTRRHPLYSDLWLVSTGAADAAAMGARRLLRHNRRELKGAYFIIMEGVGRGFPVCFKREGRLVAFRSNRRLTDIVKQVNETQAHYSAGFGRNGLYLGEGFQLISRGRRAITVSSREESRHPRFWRCAKDDYDNIDLRSLRLSLDFMTALVDNIDRGDLK
jgi:hypothetical protein